MSFPEPRSTTVHKPAYLCSSCLEPLCEANTSLWLLVSFKRIWSNSMPGSSLTPNHKNALTRNEKSFPGSLYLKKKKTLLLLSVWTSCCFSLPCFISRIWMYLFKVRTKAWHEEKVIKRPKKERIKHHGCGRHQVNFASYIYLKCEQKLKECF